MTFDFVRQLAENPELIQQVEDDSIIEFLQKDYPEREETKRIIADKFIKVKRNFEMI